MGNSQLSWVTISDLFFNSVEAAKIEDSLGRSVLNAVNEWCEMYPEIGKTVDRIKLMKDFIGRS